MRILFVIPSQYCHADGRKDRASGRLGRIANMSLLQVAGCTPPGHELDIVDDHFEEPDFNGVYDLVGITAMTAQAPRAFEIADRFRLRGTPVVMGGYHATFRPEETLQHADAVVCGEAEAVWPTLLEDRARGRMQRIYQAEEFVDPDRIPVPRYDLLARKGYRYLSWPVQVTRGCPLACNFCSVTRFYRRSYRTRRIDRVVESVRAVPSKRIFFIDDDLFIARRSLLFELFEAVKPLDIEWFTQTDLRSADNDALLERAHASGCRGLYMGFESFNPASLAAANKDRSNKIEDYQRIVRKIHGHGISVTASVIVGLEHDRPEDFDRLLGFLEENEVEELAAYMAIPLPGTPMTLDLQKAGRVLSENFSHYDGTHQLIAHANFGAGEMEATYWKLYRGFYSLPSIFRRFRRPGSDWRNRAAMMAFNVLVLRHWVRRGVHPYVANGFPWAVAAALRVRARLRARWPRLSDPFPSPPQPMDA